MTTRRSISVFALAAIAAATFSWLAPAPVGADPIADKRAEANAIQDQIDRNGARISALAEEANGARLRLTQAEQDIAKAQERAAEAQRKADHINDLLQQRAASAYTGALSGRSLEVFDVGDTKNLLPRVHYTEVTSRRDRQLLRRLEDAKREIAKQREAAESARTQAQQEQQQIDQAQREVEAANAQQQQILSKVNGELEQLVAEEQARREAEAARQAALRYASTLNSTANDNGNRINNGTGNFPPPPAPSGGAGAAIAFARSQIGKPYCYAGAGPSCYDCSGLTMRAWGAAGVVMPHYSGAQYNAFPRVPLSQMQPGDLVFWGPGGSSHVGLYIGGGQMIAAPHTGDFVKQQAVYGSPVGAVRPG
jgi:cell wall-associated NlpC family hydrolase